MIGFVDFIKVGFSLHTNKCHSFDFLQLAVQGAKNEKKLRFTFEEIALILMSPVYKRAVPLFIWGMDVCGHHINILINISIGNDNGNIVCAGTQKPTNWAAQPENGVKSEMQQKP